MAENDSSSDPRNGMDWTLLGINPKGFAWQVASALFLLFNWGVAISYVESAPVSLRVYLTILWTVAFLWVHAFNTPTFPSQLKATFARGRTTGSRVWKTGALLGILALLSRPWSWSFESGVCHQTQLVADRFRVASLEPQGLWRMLTVVLITTVAYPLLEEFAFRKWLLRAVTKRFGAIAGVVSTAALFAILHIRPSTLLSDFVFGLLLGYAAIATGNIVASFLLHYGANLALELLTTRNLQAFLVGGLDRGVFNCAPSIAISFTFVLACVGLLYWRSFETVNSRHRVSS